MVSEGRVGTGAAEPRLRVVHLPPAGRPGGRDPACRRRRAAGACPGRRRAAVRRDHLSHRLGGTGDRGDRRVCARYPRGCRHGRDASLRPKPRWPPGRASSWRPASIRPSSSSPSHAACRSCPACAPRPRSAWRSAGACRSQAVPRRGCGRRGVSQGPGRSVRRRAFRAHRWHRPGQSGRLPGGRAGHRLRRQLDGEEGPDRRRRVRHHPRARRPGARDRLRGATGVVAGEEGDDEPLEIRAADECRWDLVALGEVMLRLDPGRGPHRDGAVVRASARAAASTTSRAACGAASACARRSSARSPTTPSAV